MYYPRGLALSLPIMSVRSLQKSSEEDSEESYLDTWEGLLRRDKRPQSSTRNAFGVGKIRGFALLHSP